MQCTLVVSLVHLTGTFPLQLILHLEQFSFSAGNTVTEPHPFAHLINDLGVIRPILLAIRQAHVECFGHLN